MKSACLLVQNFYDFDVRVRRKAEALVGAGYSVDVLALRGSEQRKEYRLDGVQVYTISLGKLRGSLARYFFEYLAFFLWCFWFLMTRMPAKRYGIIDVNTLPDFLVFAAIPARVMGAKVVLDMHEITPEFYMSKYGIGEDSWRIRLMKFLERISFSFADHVIAINEPIQDLLATRGLHLPKSSVITNAAEESRFISYLESAAAEEARDPAKFVMMYHGTLTKLYGLDLAIEAFALAQHEMPGAELWILGDGPETPQLKVLAQQRGLSSKVQLVGIVSPAKIPGWLNKCDVGILPIRRDVMLEYASPNKLAEYIVMGKAVLISNLKALRHYFSENALAYFDPDDVTDIAKQMVRLYRDRGLRQQLALRAKKEYMPVSWEVMRQRYLVAMDNLVVPAQCPVQESRMRAGAKS